MLKTIIFTILLSCCSWAKPLKVAILDTGFDERFTHQAKLCDNWEHDFTGKGIHDQHGHGTNIAGIITKNAPKDFDYCLSIYKYYTNGVDASEVTVKRWNQALQKILDDGADIVNISGGGVELQPDEIKLIKQMLDKNMIVVVAAGNEYSNLNKHKYYPASSDKRLIVVGSNDVISANYGDIVDVTVSGKNQEGFDITMTGTSQATAVVTGMILNMKANCEIGYAKWMAK